MNSPQLHLLGFSPTGTGRRVLQAIAHGFDAPGAPYTDMSPRATGASTAITDGAVAVVAPVYAGRIPEVVVAYLRALNPSRDDAMTRPIPAVGPIRAVGPIPALAVVVYGNRAYDDALLELTDEMTAAGFHVVGAAAFIGEHSYASDDYQIAMGRPNASDRDQAIELGRRFRTIVTDSSSPSTVGGSANPGVPGTRPYRERTRLSGDAPITDENECILCGACETACPIGIVSVTDHVATDASRCIYCCACVKECPNGSRQVANEHVLRFAAWLAEHHREPKDPEVFLNDV